MSKRKLIDLCRTVFYVDLTTSDNIKPNDPTKLHKITQMMYEMKSCTCTLHFIL